MNIERLLQTLQDAMNELNGKDIREKSALELIGETLSRIPEIDSRFSYENFYLCYRTAHFGETPLIGFNVQYAADKRTYDGLGYQIKAIEVTLTRDLPLTLDLSSLNRRLELDIARERKQDAENKIQILERQIATETAIIDNLLATS